MRKSTKPVKANEDREEQPPLQVRQLRAAPAAPPAPPRMIKRIFTLDHPLGEVVVTMRGPAGAAKLIASHTSLSISTDGDPEEVSARSRPTRAAAPARSLSGDPNEPGGTISESLPGGDYGEAARALAPDALEFLHSMEKSEMRRASQE